MKREVHIELGRSGAVGTCATVTTRRLFRAPAGDVFVCHHAAGIMGAQWINEKTGNLPDAGLELALNDAAQAAARLAGKA